MICIIWYLKLVKFLLFDCIKFWHVKCNHFLNKIKLKKLKDQLVLLLRLMKEKKIKTFGRQYVHKFVFILAAEA